MAKKVTKRAIVASLLSLSICTSMLIGTTYAWFTDSVTSSGNIIKSGTLQVGMSWAEGRYDPTSEEGDDSDTDSIVWYEAEGNNARKIFDAEMLWEPGYTAARHIRVKNEGNLALKYNLMILAEGDADAVADLANVIDVYTKTPATQVANREEVSTKLNRVGTLREVLNDTSKLTAATQGHLMPGDKEAVITLALKMQETAGNDYQDKEVNAGLTVKLFATQYTAEEDTFDNQYDKLATYDAAHVGSPLVLVNNDTPATTKVTIPETAAQINDIFVLNVQNSGVSTDAQGKSTLSLDITLTKNGVALDTPDGNTYEVEVYVGKGLNLTAVKHNGTAVEPFTYDAETGIVKFTVTSFSPFTVEYNAPQQIAFDGNGATSGSMDAQNVYAGVATALTANGFEKTGYTFAGWATSANGAVEYTDGADITVTGATTLYAVWTVNQYTISFNANGGSAVNAITQDYDTPVTAPDAPTKAGYTFSGWNPALPETMPAENMTVAAQWTEIKPTGVTIKKNGTDTTAETIKDNETLQLTADVTPGTALDTSVTWTSSNTLVATVADGLVTPVTVGTTTITATCNGDNTVTATVALTVEASVIPATGVSLDKRSLRLIKGENETLQATVAPSTATDKTVTWTTSDSEIATVDQNGKVTAVGSGTAIITAQTNLKMSTCIVKVFDYDSLQVGDILRGGETIYPKNDIYFYYGITNNKHNVPANQEITFRYVSEYKWYAFAYPQHQSSVYSIAKCIGLRIVSGSGTSDDPFRFAYIPTFEQLVPNGSTAVLTCSTWFSRYDVDGTPCQVAFTNENGSFEVLGCSGDCVTGATIEKMTDGKVKLTVIGGGTYAGHRDSLIFDGAIYSIQSDFLEMDSIDSFKVDGTEKVSQLVHQ